MAGAATAAGAAGDALQPALVAGACAGRRLPVMRTPERVRCERIFESRDYARRGGLRYGAAWSLFKQTGVRAEDFHEAFVLAGDSVSGLLGQTVSGGRFGMLKR